MTQATGYSGRGKNIGVEIYCSGKLLMNQADLWQFQADLNKPYSVRDSSRHRIGIFISKEANCRRIVKWQEPLQQRQMTYLIGEVLKGLYPGPSKFNEV